MSHQLTTKLGGVVRNPVHLPGKRRRIGQLSGSLEEQASALVAASAEHMSLKLVTDDTVVVCAADAPT